MTTEEQVYLEIRTTRVSDLLFEVYSSATEKAIKALLLINSGGIITILTYLHKEGANCLLISSLLFL